ncbi:DctP family TRAP transporter solute-binding subunit [Salinicoccus roseus]|uniref:DctP family TRAP transporter solute-binding subunit n=1 Tax=Salinicoccus roseus TaxID=45670 RepID=UPI001CA78942|nr:DctP family TRAP transporter solute-binding subunit [Salinicoccus roseus]
MGKLKKLNLLLVMLVAIVLVACGGNGGGEEGAEGESASSGEAKTIKLAHSGSESHQYHIAAENFKEVLENKEGTNFTVEIHPNASLGSEGDAIEQVISGSLEMTTVAADSNLSNTIPEMNAFGIPYIFDDKDHVYSALDGEAGENLLSLADDKGMKGLGYWEVGFRHLTNNSTEVTVPEDVEGMKIRVQPATVWEEHMRALGANPTPVDFNELYSALDQGVVDGQENPLPTIDSMKFYEVQDYVSLTGHTYTPAVVLMSNSFYEGLSEEEATAVEEAVVEARDYQRQTLDEKEEEILTKLEDEGVTITEPEREVFREATADVKDAVSDEVPEEIVQSLIDSKE